MSPKKILVVDDEVHILHVVSLKLRNAGYEVITAQDGDEAVETFLAERPDLVITDYQMPHLSGVGFCSVLRQEHNVTDLPIVMLTARGFDLDEEEMSNAGITCVLEKPFSPREILHCVEELLGHAVP